ncbi:MAG: hypothetical protein QM784_00255 [Polyangiaceae bacterium]
MSRTESSVSLSVQSLIEAEERRRAEQVLLARHLQKEQERLAVEESARRANEAQMRAEAALAEVQRRAQAERAESERIELERAAQLERTRAELELGAKTALLQLEQRQELARLTLQRDSRVRRLEGQRLLLISLLATTLLGAVTIYGLVIRPGRASLEADLTRTLQLGEERRMDAGRERDRLQSKVNEQSRIEQDLRTKIAELERAQRATSRSDRPQERPRGPALRDRHVVPPPCTCPKADPLCDCW